MFEKQYCIGCKERKKKQGTFFPAGSNRPIQDTAETISKTGGVCGKVCLRKGKKTHWTVKEGGS